MFRKNLLEHQDKINYTNELNRIRGVLSQNDTRFPSTRENLYNRAMKLKELAGKIADDKDFNTDMEVIKKIDDEKKH